MASLEIRGNRYRVVFRYDGRKYQHRLNTDDRRKAEAALLRLEENLELLQRGRLDPPTCWEDLPLYLLSDGKLERPVRADPETLTLAALCKDYLAVCSNGSMEANSLDTVKMHLGHVRRVLGDGFAARTLGQGDLQRYIDRRARAKGIRGKKLSPTTIKKELASFRACWNWAADTRKLGNFPAKGLKYPKLEEKPRFRTWTEIEKQIARGGLNARQQRELWDALFLTVAEIEALLDFVKQAAEHPFLFPLFAFAAYTGARRSEMMRALVDDVHFDDGAITIREKKREPGALTTRRVRMPKCLAEVLRDWIGRDHPGGQYLFCQTGGVPRSKTRRTGPAALTRNEMVDHFGRTLQGSRWEVLRGWHVFRHSYVSNLAAQGVDQRLIDAWVGHQTEAMRKRYRHLLPSAEAAAVEAVFGGK